jgi:hypothetical protein
MKLIYFAYPYSDDPLRRTAELKSLLVRLIAARKDIVPFAPHFAFDAIMGYPKGYSNLYVLDWELVIISRCDAICFPAPLTPAESQGCAWERAFSRFIGIPEVEYEALLANEEGVPGRF